ncbi:MAG: cyclase family protein [Flavobacteriales bacterium]|nr:cyclase family protein [Flavobacteriales bacterium]
MKLFIELNGRSFQIDTNRFHDLSIPLRHNGQLNAYYIDDPLFSPFQLGTFIGSVAEGGPVNCFDVRFNPHGNCTHTESVGHIAPERYSVNTALKEHFFLCQLLSVEPMLESNGDSVILPEQIIPKLENNVDAIAIRTLPNSVQKCSMRYSGTNPVYVDHRVTKELAQRGIRHLLVDLPSIDREEDQGKLLAHHAFWNYPDDPRLNATITEFIYADNSIPDGTYLLNLQVAPLELDASPSRPVLFPLI